jgi:hypothetical protein
MEPADPDFDQEMLIQQLIDAVPCSQCGQSYEAHEVHVIAQDDDTWTLVAACSSCGVECLIRASMDEMNAGVQEPPDRDEVAAWGQFLAGFEGDLRGLIDDLI